MAKKEPICSLYIYNFKPTARTIGQSVLRPNSGGLVHFKSYDQVERALRLHESNDIDIKTDVPVEVLVKIRGEQAPVKEIKVEIPVAKEIASVEETSVVEEPKVTEETTVVEEAPAVEEVPVAQENEKPEWYLTYQQVEDMTKKELLAWSETVEGLKLAKSKTAEEITTLVHEFLVAQFADHAE